MASPARSVLIALGALALLPGYGSSLVLAQAEGPEPPTAVEPVAEEQSNPPPFEDSLKNLEGANGTFIESDRQGQRSAPIPEPQFNELCKSGGLSRLQCSSPSRVVVRNRGGLPLPIPADGGDPDVDTRQVRPGLDPGDGSGAGYATASGSGFSTNASPLAPISVPVSALLAGPGGNFRLTDVFGRTPRPAAALGNGNRGLLFPLIGSAVTSSGFGWRLHPVIGSWLMHAGKDLAAPEGTPVVAALSGKVVSSGLAGGYGLAIELEHDSPRRRTLYGHLSELYVREGQSVRQGEVIGRVGSTGLSTGPHLHFELRLPQEGGWVAVDPGEFDPGTLLPGGTPGQPGGPMAPDAVALLVAQLLQTLERPQGRVGAAPAGLRPSLPLPPQRSLPTPAPLPPRPFGN